MTGSLNTRWHKVQDSFDEGSSTNKTIVWNYQKRATDMIIMFWIADIMKGVSTEASQTWFSQNSNILLQVFS